MTHTRYSWHYDSLCCKANGHYENNVQTLEHLTPRACKMKHVDAFLLTDLKLNFHCFSYDKKKTVLVQHNKLKLKYYYKQKIHSQSVVWLEK